jgi:hypothetical protein
VGDAGGGGMGAGADMDALMKQMGVDPAAMQKMMGGGNGIGMMDDLQDLGPQLEEVMKLMADMSPEELATQMQEAMDMFTGDDMMANMLGNSDEILKTLENSGAVDAEELEKFRRDPEYFEQKMKESMEQMQQIFSDPSMLETAQEGMKAAQDMYKNPNAASEMMESMMKDLSDEDIESVRQMFIENDGGGDPMMQQLLGTMDTKDFEEVLKDPVTWRKTVKEGLGMFKQQQGQVGAGAGVGEL